MTAALHEMLSRVAGWLWPSALDHLWQASLFAVVVGAVALAARRGPARVRHALWLVAAAKFVLPSAVFAQAATLLGVEAGWLAGSGGGTGGALVYRFAEPAESLIYAAEATAADGSPHNELYCALTLVWALGCVAFAAAWWLRRRQSLLALREGREVFAGREFEALERARARLGLRAEVLLVLTKRRAEPGVWRTRRPVAVLPEAFADELEDEELEAVMLHELAHVERRDNLFGNLQTALCCLYWFHPLVWLIGRRLLEERERACDERVLEAGGASAPYAAAILKVVRFCFGWRVAGVSGVAAGSNLRRRVEEIMRGEKRRGERGWQRALPLTLGALALAFTAGAGLLGPGRSAAAALLPAETLQEPGATVVVQGGVARAAPARAGDGPAVREVESAPETMIQFEYDAGAPLAVTSAKLRLITRDQLRRADAETADSFYDEADGEKSEFYVTLPTVTVANMSVKKVREVGIGFVRGGKMNVVTGHAVSLAPGESQTFVSEWKRRNIIMPGTPADVSVRLVWAAFADGSQWGARAEPPHPPPPPPPPARAGTGATAAVIAAPSAEGRPAVAATGATSAGVGSGRGEGGAALAGGGTATVYGGGAAVAGGGTGRQAGHIPPPKYPPIAKAARAEGEVSVRVTVDEEGNVISAKAVSGHPLLQTAAVDAARAAKFKPTLLEGKPVKVSAVITYNFELDDEEGGGREPE